MSLINRMLPCFLFTGSVHTAAGVSVRLDPYTDGGRFGISGTVSPPVCRFYRMENELKTNGAGTLRWAW